MVVFLVVYLKKYEKFQKSNERYIFLFRKLIEVHRTPTGSTFLELHVRKTPSKLSIN